MRDPFIEKLSSLGCQFAIENVGLEADPEVTIIEALDYFWKDKKIFTMLLGLLKYRLYFLINTKRLLYLSNQLSDERKALLAVVTLKVAKSSGDERFLQLSHHLRKPKVTLKRVPEKYSDPFYVARKGIDKEFKKIKVTLAGFFDNQPERKFKPFKKIYLENKWLRLRAIVGPEYRADALYLSATRKIITQAEVARILGCNKSSISRIWSSIKDLESLTSMIV